MVSESLKTFLLAYFLVSWLSTLYFVEDFPYSFTKMNTLKMMSCHGGVQLGEKILRDNNKRLNYKRLKLNRKA
jgi:hypothetical protein